MPCLGNNASGNITSTKFITRCKIFSFTRETQSSAHFPQSGVSLGVGSNRLNRDDGFIDSRLEGSQILDVKESQDLGSFVEIFITSIKTEVGIFERERFSLGYHRAGVLQRSLVQPGGDKLADGEEGDLVVRVLGNLEILGEKYHGTTTGIIHTFNLSARDSTPAWNSEDEKSRLSRGLSEIIFGAADLEI